jgi:3-mercaptopyruvate sulfurtransferase SseA
VQAGKTVAVLDLLNFEAELEDEAGIPGAVRLDAERLRRNSRVIAPADLDIVLYYRSSGELTSARVALSMRKKGIMKVWILDGGLMAWKAEGFPVTSQLSTGAEAAARLGIRIIMPAGRSA